MPTDIDHETPPQDRYAYKASLMGSAHLFELTKKGLSWKIGGRSDVWAYTDIASIRLSFRPVTMQSHRFRADIRHASGRRITVLSTTWQTVALMVPQNQDYRAFITALHQRMAAAGSRAVLSGGLTTIHYGAAMVCLALLAVAMAGLLVRAIATGEWPGVLFLLAFAAWFVWQIGGFVRRNRPITYTFDHVPESLLP
ncbi:hypothetical protein JQ628_22330 [Bradyrhizobium lablabi]|uniref:hypothetical protein n=1 Tax=Bradyrhizobium lablabi TaxID=722472 RepID=UPI001BA5BD83|nr:hypothetical protein [Bradyrhizobium lablabi]MBR1124282.1 hypothetical protein [Bradyrhizobium lablabi]